MEPAGNSSIHRINPPLSPIIEPDDEEAQLLAVEAAEYFPSPSNRMEFLMQRGNYEAAAKEYQSLPASPAKEALFNSMSATLYTHTDYMRTWPILFGLIHPTQKHAFMFNLVGGLIDEKRCAFIDAKNNVEKIVTDARLDCEPVREQIINRKALAIYACSTVPALKELYQSVKLRQSDWNHANESLLQTSYRFYADAMKDLQQLQEPDAVRDLVTRTLRHPALEQAREIVAAVKQELDETIHLLFQEAMRLQIPAVIAILSDTEEKERRKRMLDSRLEGAVLSLQQKRQELGEVYEKTRFVYRFMENSSWKEALEMKMLANLTDMEQRSQFSAWLNSPS